MILNRYIIFFLIALASQIIYITLAFGHLIFGLKKINKYWYLLFLTGGCQILLSMIAARYGSIFISILNIQLILIIISYLYLYVIDLLILKTNTPNIYNVLSFSLLLIGIYISKKYEVLNTNYFIK
jgi:hypothetical protein